MKAGDLFLHAGFDLRQSTSTTTSAMALASVAAKVRMAGDGIDVLALLFMGDVIPGYSGSAVYNTNTEIVAVVNRTTKDKLDIAFFITPVVDFYKTNRARSTAPPR